MYIDYHFEELLKKFKSELEKKENYIDDVRFPPFQRLNHLEVLNEVYALCNCIQEEFKEWDDKKAYLDDLKSRHEELIRKPLFNLIDEAYYYTKNVVYLHAKEKQGIGTFLKPAYECSEDVVNKYQAIKTYRYNLQSTDEYVVCDYAVEVINEIWCSIESGMLNGMNLASLKSEYCANVNEELGKIAIDEVAEDMDDILKHFNILNEQLHDKMFKEKAEDIFTCIPMKMEVFYEKFDRECMNIPIFKYYDPYQMFQRISCANNEDIVLIKEKLVDRADKYAKQIEPEIKNIKQLKQIIDDYLDGKDPSIKMVMLKEFSKDLGYIIDKYKPTLFPKKEEKLEVKD